MQTFRELTEELEKVKVGSEESTCATILARNAPWRGIVAEHLRCLDELTFLGLYEKTHYPNVQPTALLLAEIDQRFQVIAHHFDREPFDKLMGDNLASAHKAHRHNYGFATRILCGQYVTWQYNNKGTKDSVRLERFCSAVCSTGSVHWIGPERFHSVLIPKSDTVTLVIRCGINPIHYDSKNFDREYVLDTRQRVIQALKSSVDATEGTVNEELCGY